MTDAEMKAAIQRAHEKAGFTGSAGSAGSAGNGSGSGSSSK